jgi:hypothetical protein
VEVVAEFVFAVSVERLLDIKAHSSLEVPILHISETDFTSIHPRRSNQFLKRIDDLDKK